MIEIKHIRNLLRALETKMNIHFFPYPVRISQGVSNGIATINYAATAASTEWLLGDKTGIVNFQNNIIEIVLPVTNSIEVLVYYDTVNQVFGKKVSAEAVLPSKPVFTFEESQTWIEVERLFINHIGNISVLPNDDDSIDESKVMVDGSQYGKNIPAAVRTLEDVLTILNLASFGHVLENDNEEVVQQPKINSISSFIRFINNDLSDSTDLDLLIPENKILIGDEDGKATSKTIAELKVLLAYAIADLALTYDYVMVGNSGGVGSGLSVTEQTLIGRITGGHIAALSASQIRTLLSIIDAHIIMNNGTAKTQRANLDFVGDFTVTDDAGNGKTIVKKGIIREGQMFDTLTTASHPIIAAETITNIEKDAYINVLQYSINEGVAWQAFSTNISCAANSMLWIRVVSFTSGKTFGSYRITSKLT